MISQIVGRCHIGEDYTDVLRYVITRIKGKKKTWRKLPREERREIVREVCKEHKANRELYNYVMRGCR